MLFELLELIHEHSKVKTVGDFAPSEHFAPGKHPEPQAPYLFMSMYCPKRAGEVISLNLRQWLAFLIRFTASLKVSLSSVVTDEANL